METGSLQLGSLKLTNGQPRLSGSASGLDIESLVSSLATAKRLPAARLEKRIEGNASKIAALGDIRDSLTRLRDAVAALRSAPGSSAASSVFEAKETFFSSSTTTSPASLLGVVAGTSAAVGRSTVVVERLATAAKIGSGSVSDAAASLAATRNGGVGFTGTIELGLDGRPAATIEIDGTMTLNDLRARINASSASSGVSASVLRVAPGDERLVLTATETGRAITMAHAGGDDVLDILGLSGDGGVTAANPLQEARTSRIIFDGVAIERPGNRLTDVAEGLTIDLVGADPGTTVTIDVQRSLGAIKEKITAFVDAYNGFRDLVAAQQKVGADGRVAESAVLFGSSLLRGIAGDLAASLGASVQGLAPTLPRTLGELGIRFDGANRLTIDDERLNQRLLDDVDAVRSVFDFTGSLSSGTTRILQRGSTLPANSAEIAIVDSDADGFPESATIGGTAADISGRLVRGAAGSAWEGWTFAWTGTGDETVTMTATQGLADRLFSSIDQVIDQTNGRVQREIDQLSGESDRFRTEIGRIDARVEDYRNRLVERFNLMETALSQAKAMLQQLTATTNAWYGSKQ
jgi:flagellar hook-associated protein 2